jgi:hypothetical protein
MLSGCEVQQTYDATCSGVDDPTTGPGHVAVDVEIPPHVAAGATFTVRVDSMAGWPDPAGVGSSTTGAVSVTGPVTPSGTFSVGEPYPNTLTFTATGQPGENISLDAVRGSSSYLVPPGFVLVFECTAHDGHIADIPIVAP